MSGQMRRMISHWRSSALRPLVSLNSWFFKRFPDFLCFGTKLPSRLLPF
jgi:hypothetical protein